MPKPIKWNYPKFNKHALNTIALYDEIERVNHPDELKYTPLGFVTTKHASVTLNAETGHYTLDILLSCRKRGHINLEINRPLTIEGVAAWLHHANQIRSKWETFQPPCAVTADPAQG